MSFPETAPKIRSQSSSGRRLQLGPVADRFLAFILDFLILSPVVSFAVASILRNLKTVLLLNSNSEEAVVIWALFILGMILVSSFLQAVFLYFWQATPGQKFLQLRVASFPMQVSADKKLTFAQCLTRSLGWWGATFCAGVPFMEILSHPLRRAFHERLSDTVVVSLKQGAVDRPLAVEARYIGSTMWLFFGFLFVSLAAFVGRSYKTAVAEGLSSDKTYNQAVCSEVSPDKYKGQKRLDMALALYFAEAVDEACVYTEAQKVVWNADGEEKALGQLAMAVIAEDDKEASAYQKKVCGSSERSEACAISNYLQTKDADRGNILRRAGLGLVSSRLLLLKNSMELGNYASAMVLIRDLEVETSLQSFLDKNLVKAAWALNTKENRKDKDRTPASNDEKQVLKEFKKRYGIE